ncbi:hypothetical protein CRM90_28145 [Mycobacterium sp. ENV421]|nr:hypothetical protein CRM90_28145 [Mycobacterium sp. ENV421]
MTTTVLAHGGQLTGDEIAFISGGILFALLFPILVLVVVARRTRSHDDENEPPPQTEASEAPGWHQPTERSS